MFYYNSFAGEMPEKVINGATLICCFHMSLSRFIPSFNFSLLVV